MRNPQAATDRPITRLILAAARSALERAAARSITTDQERAALIEALARSTRDHETTNETVDAQK
jgi:hypothetical protein